ncbi:hypothetical protein ACFO3J_16710 [Streptomyces polygonati]|uniref:Secreted protein n=1 Tax=Streptomyces polygonati TaxID=1617087 RepID=A0ABV8HQI1_9ACTN
MSDPETARGGPVPRGTSEPILRAVRPRHWLRSLLRRASTITAVLAVLASGTVIAVSGKLLLPFQQVTTLHGRLASIGDFFEDPQVVRILRKHGLRVEVSLAGSRQVATGSLEGLDFVFPSGKPASDLIWDHRHHQGLYENSSQPFESPLVLASFREYAETLVDQGIAVPQPAAPGQPQLYYTIDMSKFLKRTADSPSWNDLGVARHGLPNGNAVVAQTSDICDSNSADSYLSLVAFAANDNRPPTEDEVPDVARRIKGLLLQQSPSDDLYSSYTSAHGPSTDPIAVLYEHQYLAYQAGYQAAHGGVDTERVLLYPKSPSRSQPHFIALDRKADRLGTLLGKDPELRRRATELGYQILPDDNSQALDRYLDSRHIPSPNTYVNDLTEAKMPPWGVLEDMIAAVKPCPTVAD